MDRKLIISAWLPDSACAAAILLIRHPESEIMPLSRSKLPLYLDELSRNKLTAYSEIYILGVPLDSPNEQMLRDSLRRLKKRGSRIFWFSSYPIPTKAASDTLELLDARISSTEMELCRFVADDIKMSLRLGNIQNIVRLTNKQCPLSDADKERKILIEAGMSRYRRFQELAYFVDAVKTISRNAPLSDQQKELISEFERFGHRELRGTGRQITEIKELVKLVGSNGNCSVLICGETGTGKETIASLIHGNSPRKNEPFIEFNCAMMSPQLAESALFGHEKGAFTGAESRRIGVFEQADGGTLFLDEIGDLPLQIQAGILRVMQESRFRRLGGMETIKTDVRIIAATNRDIKSMIRNKEFREDLLYRLDVVRIDAPPLRARREDIEAIANSFLIQRCQPRLKHEELETLKGYDWPGNVRELLNILERSLVLKTRDFRRLMAAQRLSTGVHGASASSENMHENNLALVRIVYAKYSRNKTQTAKALGITVNTLKKYLGEIGDRT